MESYLQKLWKRSYEEIQIRIIIIIQINLHNFVIFMILVKRTLNRMTSLEGTQSS